MAYTLSSSTFSISSPVVIKNGTEEYGKILTTDASGLVKWTESNSFFGTSRYIGELYGGGIVVDFWKEGDVENTLIMSLKHLSYDYIWSNIETVTSISSNYYQTYADSLYDGRYNSDMITSHIVYDSLGNGTIVESHTMSAAKMCKDYNYDGYEDWYLPSYNEFNSIIKNRNIINKALGDVDGIRSQNTGSGSELSGDYWTSTEYFLSISEPPLFPGGPNRISSGSYAIKYSTSDSRFKQEIKTKTAMVRAVRREEKLTGNGLVLSLDAGNKNSYDDSKRGNVWYDLVNKGITASAGLTFSASATGVTYSATNSGYLTFGTYSTSYIDFKANLGNTTVVTVEMFARLKSTSGSIFTWGNGYSILSYGPIGFFTGSSDAYGISQLRVAEYGLLNNWKHYIFVMRTDVSYTNNKIYVNGDQIVLTPNGGTENTKSFFSGVGKINPPNAGFANGAGMDLAVFNIYKRELNQTEIINNFNKYKKRFEVKDKTYQKDLILNLNSNNINSFNPTNLTTWNDTKFTSDTRILRPLTFTNSNLVAPPGLEAATYSNSDGAYPGTYINFNNKKASIASPITFTYSTTWEVWVKFNSISPNTFNMFMGQGLPYFAINSSNSNKLMFSNSYSGLVGSSTSDQSYHYSNSSLTINVWYHLAFTTKYDPVSNTTSSKIYINGLSDYSNTIITNGPNNTNYDRNYIPGYQINNYPSYKFALGDGCNLNPNNGVATWFPNNCSISEVRIYNRTLSAVEIENNYNSSKHLYDIDKKHYTHNFNTSPTFSIFQNLTLDFPNKQNNSILVSDSKGLVSLSTPDNLLPDRKYKRSVGDLYAGGIIVSVLEYLSSTYYLIASLVDYNFSTGYYWSTLSASQSSVLPTGANTESEFTGSQNTDYIITQIGIGTYAASIAKSYSYEGYNDWYLPSTQELREAYNNSNIINLVLGNNTLKETYWTSTESGFTSGLSPKLDAYAFNFGAVQTGLGLGTVPGQTASGLEFPFNKYRKLKVRPFRTEVYNNITEFITVWKTDNPGTSATNQITIPTNSSSYIYNYDVDWGDGTKSTGCTTNITHTYTTPGTYTVKIKGTFPSIYFNNALDKLKILQVKNWGSIVWTSMSSSFDGCSNLMLTATDAPDLSNVTTMSGMFRYCSSLNQSIDHWDVSTIITFSQTFYGCTTFNQPLNSWNLSSCSSTSGMFYGCSNFNQPLSNWNTSNILNLSAMFVNCVTFNQPLTTSGNKWNVSAVTDMNQTFSGCANFNQPLNSWNTLAVTNMSYMFYGAANFNQPLSNWNTSAVTNMSGMFRLAQVFNQPLTTNGNMWNVSAVKDFSSMFQQAFLFNKSLSSWNTSSALNMSGMFKASSAFNNGLSSGLSGSLNFVTNLVTNMFEMFYAASAFNQSIITSGNIWNVSAVTDMSYMFFGATVFNQNISNWNVSAVINMSSMFRTAFAFNCGSATEMTWETTSATNMRNMFDAAIAFNKPLLLRTNLVTNMAYMFASAAQFNQNLEENPPYWNTGSVIDMSGMFRLATSFNNGGFANMAWNTSAVTNMLEMFYGATVFNSNISTWQTSNVTNMSYMFSASVGGTTAFNKNIGSWNVSNVTNFTSFMSIKTNLTFSTTNLDAIYIGWASRPVKPSLSISFGTAKRTAASTAARLILTSAPNNWVITDGGI